MNPAGPEPASSIPDVGEAMESLAAVADAPPADQVTPLAEADRVLRETLDSIGDI